MRETTAAKATGGRGSMKAQESDLVPGGRRVGEPPRSRRTASQARREGAQNTG